MTEKKKVTLAQLQKLAEDNGVEIIAETPEAPDIAALVAAEVAKQSAPVEAPKTPDMDALVAAEVAKQMKTIKVAPDPGSAPTENTPMSFEDIDKGIADGSIWAGLAKEMEAAVKGGG